MYACSPHNLHAVCEVLRATASADGVPSNTQPGPLHTSSASHHVAFACCLCISHEENLELQQAEADLEVVQMVSQTRTTRATAYIQGITL